MPVPRGGRSVLWRPASSPPGACPAVGQLRALYLGPGSSSASSGSSVPVPPAKPPGAASPIGTQGDTQGGGRAEHPWGAQSPPVEHPMVPPPPPGRRWRRPFRILPSLLSPQGGPRPPSLPHGVVAMEGASVLSPSSWEKRRAWARQSRCWRTTVVEEEAAAAMQDVPELQPPHLDDVFLEGSGSWWGEHPRVLVRRGVPPCWGASRVFLCVPPPQEAPPAR